MSVGHRICSQLPAEASALTYLAGFHMPYYYESVGYISWFKKKTCSLDAIHTWEKKCSLKAKMLFEKLSILVKKVKKYIKFFLNKISI